MNNINYNFAIAKLILIILTLLSLNKKNNDIVIAKHKWNNNVIATAQHK